MGTWGTGPFENDDALDWVGDFLDNPKPAMVKETLDQMITVEDDEWLDAVDESRGSVVAAAELVAAMHGKPAPELPEDLEEWIEANKGKWKADPLLKPALKAMTNLRDHADEILDSWFDKADAKAWVKSLDDLVKRLS